MKLQIFKAFFATLLLACGLSKASAAIDPTASHSEAFTDIKCGALPPCIVIVDGNGGKAN